MPLIAQINAALRDCLPVSHLPGAARLNSAIDYAVFPGGRRMRPMLTLLAAEICGADPAVALRAAAAVEFLHAASLIFDDLPCMDDAGLRRGAPTAHMVFGTDVSILAALALMNRSYALFSEVPGLLAIAVDEIGENHLIGGQAVDVSGGQGRCRMEKTTALLRLTMAAGAAAANAPPSAMRVLTAFGSHLGEAYQIFDDLTDPVRLDKTPGQDRRGGRCTVIDEIGAQAAANRARQLIEQACQSLLAHFANSKPAGVLIHFARKVA